MKAIKVIITCAIVLSITACGSVRPPATSYYLLSAPPLSGNTTVNRPIPVQVEMAEFLTTGTLTLQQDDQRLQPAHYQRWAQPLPGMIARYVQRELQRHGIKLSDHDSLHLVFDNFHGSTSGTVHVSGQWWLDSTEQAAETHLFDLSAAQSDSGYTATVTTLQQLLDRLCDEIATGLQNGSD